MSISDKIKRNKYLSLLYLIKSFWKTRKISIKSSNVNFKKLAENNKKRLEPYVILSTYGSIVDPYIMKRNFAINPIYNVYNMCVTLNRHIARHR